MNIDIAEPVSSRHDVGDYLSDAVAFGNLVLAAYAMADEGGLNPPKPSSFPADYEILSNVIMKDFLLDWTSYQFYGFLAVKKGTAEVILVVRGTNSIIEFIDDAYSIVPVPFYTYGKVGDGWAKIYSTMRTSPRSSTAIDIAPPDVSGSFASQVAAVVREYFAAEALDVASMTMDCVGHSLGSALITLYTLERLIDPTYPMRKFYTFASPLVGDQTFVAAFNKQPFEKYRIYNTSDPVPNLPPFVGFVPVNHPVRYVLNAKYWWEDPFCSHSMQTYMNCLDPQKYPPATACTNPLVARRPNRAATPKSVELSQGATTITITIQTDGKPKPTG